MKHTESLICFEAATYLKELKDVKSLYSGYVNEVGRDYYELTRTTYPKTYGWWLFKRTHYLKPTGDHWETYAFMESQEQADVRAGCYYEPSLQSLFDKKKISEAGMKKLNDLISAVEATTDKVFITQSDVLFVQACKTLGENAHKPF